MARDKDKISLFNRSRKADKDGAIVEKQKVSIFSIMNFCCILLFTAITVCYVSAFFQFKGLAVTSLHDLVGFPLENTALQKYIAENNLSSFVEAGKLNMTMFVFAPVFIIIFSILGAAIYGFKIKSENLCYYNVGYGLLGVISFAAIDVLRLGSSWVFQVVVFSIFLALGIAQIIIKFVIKKDIEFDMDLQKTKNRIIALVGTVAFVATVLFVATNVKVQQKDFNIKSQAKTIEEKETEITDLKKGSGDYDAVIQKLIEGTPVEEIISDIESGEISVTNKDDVLENLKKLAEKAAEAKTSAEEASTSSETETSTASTGN